MKKYQCFKIILILLAGTHCQNIISNVDQNFIISLNNKLNVKHMSIIKDPNFQINPTISDFVKKLSKQKIYTSILNVREMYDLMQEYYEALNEYGNGYLYQYNYEIKKRKAFKVFPSKITILVYGKHAENVINEVFKVKITRSGFGFSIIIMIGLKYSAFHTQENKDK